eukprot:3433292-Pyramimonas_sp.AAC.1
MARRWGPVEGALAEPTDKGRRCVHGHKDPDTGSLFACAPTPQAASIHMFMQVIKVERGSLIRLKASAHGLDDAPSAWRKTITGCLEEQGFTRSLLEPCW